MGYLEKAAFNVTWNKQKQKLQSNKYLQSLTVFNYVLKWFRKHLKMDKIHLFHGLNTIYYIFFKCSGLK